MGSTLEGHGCVLSCGSVTVTVAEILKAPG